MPAAIGIIFNKSRDQVLLVKRRDVPVWVLPGGGIDPGESPEEAVCRELHEETGLDTEVMRKIAEYIPANKLASFTYFFECRATGGTPSPTEESLEARFYPIDSLPKNLFHIHKEFLEDALVNRPFVIQKVLNQVSYSQLIKYFLRHPLRVLRFGLSRIGLPLNQS